MGRGVSRRRSCRRARPSAGGELLLLLVRSDSSLAHAALLPAGSWDLGGTAMDLLQNGRLSGVHRFEARKTLPSVVPGARQRPGGSSGLTAITRSRRVQTKTPRRSPGLGSAGTRLPGKGLHRHIGQVCSIGWRWDAPAPVLELCLHVFCSFQSRERGKGPSPPSHSVPLVVTKRDPVSSDTPVALTWRRPAAGTQ